MTQLAHSVLGASSMYRWSACAGSVRMSRGIPGTTSSYAQEGTDCHELMALRLLDIPPTLEQAMKFNGEMYDAIDIYLKEIEAQLWAANLLSRARAIRTDALLVEHRFDLSKVYPGCFGTADTVVWNAKERLLTVTDLKYGAGYAVEVEKNSQLLYYALGALISLNLPAIYVEIVVVQPRCPHADGPIRRWRISSLELLEFQSDLVRFAKATEDPNAPLVSGKHCKFCPAAGICPTLHRQANELAVTEFSPVLNYDPQKLANALDKLDVIEDWAKSVRAFAYAESERGRTPPGYKLVAKRAMRRWAFNDKQTIDQIVSRARINPDVWFTEPALISPAQAEKVLKEQGLEKTLFENLIVSISSGGKLVRVEEAGTAIQVGPAAEFTVLGLN